MRKQIGRAAILGFLALAAAAPASARPHHMLPRAADGLIVDVSRLRALGLGAQADVVQAVISNTLSGEARGGGNRLVVRVTGLSLSSVGGTNSGGGDSESGGGGAVNNDYLEGEALVVGPGGEVVDRVPQLMVLPSTSGGAYYLPGQEQRRIETLSRDFALWLKRRLG